MLTKRVALSMFVVSALAGLITPSACTGNKMGHDVYTEYYVGAITAEGVTYSVYIDENNSTEGGFLRIVHLDRVSDPEMRRITGHSGNAGDIFTWDRIFYCGPRTIGDKALGCNSVERTDKEWVFVPCEADKDRVTPFNETEIDTAEMLLNSAVLQVRTPEHLTEQWAWDPVQQKVRQIYSMPERGASN